VRALESAWTEGGLREGEGATRLFITPGYRFKVVRQIFTNFHTPGSTLLVLVCAFAGTQRIVRAYREAVEKRYRFFSYGDAMLIQ
jgi:S-adenosylmethionine:tRNA ribosyltransferase-isomerase